MNTGTIEALISQRKTRLQTISIPYLLRNWIDGKETPKGFYEAQKENDETDRQVLRMFEKLLF